MSFAFSSNLLQIWHALLAWVSHCLLVHHRQSSISSSWCRYALFFKFKMYYMDHQAWSPAASILKVCNRAARVYKNFLHQRDRNHSSTIYLVLLDPKWYKFRTTQLLGQTVYVWIWLKTFPLSCHILPTCLLYQDSTSPRPRRPLITLDFSKQFCWILCELPPTLCCV